MNLIETLQTLGREGVDFVLVGGLAVSLHGVVRGTMDVDIDALRRLPGAENA